MNLAVVNGSSGIARSVVKSILATNPGKYASIKLIDARPHRTSVYNWQASLEGVHVQKHMALSGQSIEIGLEGADKVLYFTHDYFTMASDKNQHLKATAAICKKVGAGKLVAVRPLEHELAWSEDQKSFIELAKESQEEALSKNSKMVLFNTNLVFGPETFFLHYLA